MKLLSSKAVAENNRFIYDVQAPSASRSSETDIATEASMAPRTEEEQFQSVLKQVIDYPDDAIAAHQFEQQIQGRIEKLAQELTQVEDPDITIDALGAYLEANPGVGNSAFAEFTEIQVLVDDIRVFLEDQGGNELLAAREAEAALMKQYPTSFQTLIREYNGDFYAIPAKAFTGPNVPLVDRRAVFIESGTIDFRGHEEAEDFLGLTDFYAEEYIKVDGEIFKRTEAKSWGKPRPGYGNEFKPYRAIYGGETVDTTVSLEEIKTFEANNSVTGLTSERANELQDSFFEAVDRGEVQGKFSVAPINIDISEYSGEIPSHHMQMAVNLIAREEGFRAKPYYDVNGYAIGYGAHQIQNASGEWLDVVPGMTINKQTALALLPKGIETHVSVLKEKLGADFSKLNANQFAALASVAYNFGPNVFAQQRGENILNAIRNGEQDIAQMLIRSLSDGRKIDPTKPDESRRVRASLQQRRGREADLFSRPEETETGGLTAEAAYAMLNIGTDFNLVSSGAGFSEDGTSIEGNRTGLVGLQRSTILGAKALLAKLRTQTGNPGLKLTITGGTEKGHSAGRFSHGNGFKLDFSLRDSGGAALVALTGLNQNGKIPTKSVNGYRMLFDRHENKGASGDHMDVTFYNS